MKLIGGRLSRVGEKHHGWRLLADRMIPLTGELTTDLKTCVRHEALRPQDAISSMKLFLDQVVSVGGGRGF